MKALGFINLSSDRCLKISDIGCGTGGQNITRSQNLNGEIIAVDLFPKIWDELNEKLKKLGLKDKIVTLKSPWMICYLTVKDLILFG